MKRLVMKRLAREDGWSLIELLIGITLMLVAVGVAADGLFNVSKTSATAQLHTFSQTQNRVGMERLTYLIRQAAYKPGVSVDARNTNPIISYAGRNKVVFTSRGAGSDTVQQYTADVSGTNLRVGSATCTAGSPCSTWTTPTMSTLITNVQNSSTGPCAAKNANDITFKYYAPNSAAGTLSEVATPTDGTSIANQSLPTLDTVQIALWTQESGNDITNTCERLTARVNLRNLTIQ